MQRLENSGGSNNLDGRNRDKNVLMLFTAIEAGLISDKALDYLHLPGPATVHRDEEVAEEFSRSGGV